MLVFNFTSLSFKPAIDQKRQFIFSVTTFDGTTISTEPSSYDPANNVAVFSEMLEIKPFISNRNTFLILELFQQEDVPVSQNNLTPTKISKPVLICKRVLESSSQSLKELNQKALSLKTSLTGKGNVAIEGSLKLSVRIVKNSNEIETPKDQDLGLLKPFLDEMKQFSQDQKGEFEILKANSINANYVKKITPVVLITNYLHDVFNWKSPVHTIIFGMAVTLGTLYVQYILAFSLLLFYINTPFFLRLLMKMPHKKKKKEGNVFERNKAKILKFKRNMTHIQETQKDYLKKYDYVKKLVWSEDRTLLIETVVGLRKFVILMLPFIIFINPQVLFLIFFWVMLIKNSAYGKSLVEEVGVRFDAFNVHLNRKIDGFVTKYRLFPVPPANQPDLRKVSDNQISQKTFVIYENQRWWIGKGWSDLLERPKFSDIEGILALDFKKVTLPEPEEEWIWESDDWKVEISDKTDSEGWEYAYDFKNEFHPQNSKFDYARRKKWVRSCTRASQNKF